MDFYGTAAGYTAYHTARGRDVSGQTEPDIEQALLVSSEWLDGSFDWPGYKVGTRETQTRDWPRSWVHDRDGYLVDHLTVPTEIEHATYEVAYRYLADNTVLSPDFTPEKYKRVTIDGALSVEYRGLDAAAAQKQFPVLGVILASIIGGRATSALSSGIARV